MAYIPQAERDALDSESFGDPKNRLFPIRNQQDVHDAAHLIGKAKNPEAVKRRIIAIARRKGFSIPDAWKEKGDAKMSVAEFSIGDGSDDGEWVLYPDSLLFTEGQWEDKNFEMSREELFLAAEQFSEPVPIDLEHVPTVLDGKLGEVRSVRVSEDATQLFGTVAIPKWLDKVLGDAPKRVSCQWDRATKTLAKLALTGRPRIEGAALFAAFAEAQFAAPRHSTPQGRSTMQAIHDYAAGSGAVCDPDNSPQFVSGRERSGLQKVHDMAVDHGASCSVMSGSSATYSATHPTQESAMPDESNKVAEEKPAATETKETPAVVSFADSPEAKAMREEIEQLKNQVKAAQRRQLFADAASFADGEIKESRALPTERDNLIALFVQASIDDAAPQGAATFSVKDEAGSIANRVALLKAWCAARPKHSLFKEQMAAGDFPEGSFVLFHKDKAVESEKLDRGEVDNLLSLTHTGQQALKLRQAQ